MFFVATPKTAHSAFTLKMFMVYVVIQATNNIRKVEILVE